MAERPPDKPPIFITGNPRSGTTLMRELLSAHPNIYITHESWFYIWNSLAPKEMGGDEFLDYYFDTFSFRWLRLPTDKVLENLPRPLARKDVYLAFREVMRLKAERLGRRRYGEKTPGHIEHLAAILRDFPDAKVIHMVRDPRSTVDSTGKMVWGCRSDLGNCIVYERARRKVEAFQNRMLQVKLETLRLQPEAEMRRVLDFVGEEWDDALLDHAAHNPDPNDMPPVPWLATAKDPLVSTEIRLPSMSPERLRLIETVCARGMKEYDYEPAPIEGGPGKLATWMRILSEVPETVRYAIKMIRVYTQLRDPERWRTPGAAYGRMFAGLNPTWWKEHPGFEFPPVPERITTSTGTPKER